VPNITAKSCIVVDVLNGKTLFQKNENTKREIASLTKLMTAHVVIDLVHKMNIDPNITYVEVSYNASTQIGTSADLRPKEMVTITDLLYGLLLPSGNDAAVALAENFGMYLYYESNDFDENNE
jgi:D-alanyl-D-alanine carboxypeptidase (penicillin-binding protein 5/6)